ncbi:MAG: D-alanine--D-alanine ligase [Deltaproteobacteria bacterium]|nr:D-alanine--D-alanine ligase [Deltaproteobacteria bacterium]
MTRRLRVGVVFGGRSGEHEVSLLSARSILDALDRERYEPVLIGIDHAGRWHLQDAARALLETPGAPLHLDPTAPSLAVSPGASLDAGSLVPSGAREAVAQVGALDVFFPVVHGTYGEDGTLQGLFEMTGAPYVGSGVLGSSAGMDKDIARRLLRDAGLPVVDWLLVRARERDPDAVAARVAGAFGYPCFVKPANMGSSVGVSKVRGPAGLAAALARAFRYDTRVVVERGLDVRELECAVLGNERPEASVLGEVSPTHEFYSYEAKYLDEHGASLEIPARVSDEQSQEARQMAVRAFEALDLAGLARVDFFLERGTGRWYVNEVNTLPGFTRISMYPKLWEATGLSYRALVDRLLTLALERHGARRALSTRYTPDDP